MANDKYYGYSPKKEESPSRLDKFNPYEFRKGMDIELTDMGVSRLAESTPEEREKATEIVLKNLEEHNGYYSALTQYKGGMNQGSKIDKDSLTFKKYLEGFKSDYPGTGMVEVGKEIKNDKMEELKEAIKAEVKTMLSEVSGKEAEKINKADAKKEKSDKKDSDKAAKKKGSEIKNLEKEIESLKSQKEKNLKSLEKPLEKYKKGLFNKKKYDSAKAEYMDVSKELVDDNKDIVKKIKEKEKEIEDIQLKEKMDKREVAKSMMERDTHMELLKIIKEAGVSLREGSGGVKMYYEIAKVAYQEGFMAGLKK